jgi:very-short-patch-repair endonuclease
MLSNKSKIKFMDTDIELKFKEELIKRNIKFIHPYKIPKYPHLADFYIPNCNLIIECDGSYWHQLPKHIKKDKINNYTMRNKGYFVKRLKGDAILEERINYDKMFNRYAKLKLGS